MSKNNPVEKDADLIIICAGPAGLSAAQYGARSALDVLVLEQLAPGGQALLIDILENYPGITDEKTGLDFCQDLHRQAERFGARFLTEQVLSIENPIENPMEKTFIEKPSIKKLEKKSEQGFTLNLGSGSKLNAPALILATGAKHRKLDIPGEEEYSGKGVSYCASCDGPFFRNKKILVVGGGDAACDEAQYLSRLASNLIVVHRRDRFRAQKALAERVLYNPRIQVRFNTVVREIRGNQKVQSVILESSGAPPFEEAFDAVFIYAGIIPQSDLVPDAEKNEAGYIITDTNMASSIPGLFAAGDVRASPFRQVVVAAAEGAIAAHKAAAYLDALKGESY